MFRVLAVFVISLLLFVGCADVEAVEPPIPPVTTKPSPTPSPLSMTSPQKVKKIWDVQIGSVDRFGKSLEWSPYGRTEEASGEWLVVEVSLKNIGTSDNSLHRETFRVKDAAGKVYNHYSDLTVAEVYGLYRGGDLIDNKVILPGANVNSYLVFDVPSDATDLKLEFTPNPFAKSETFALNSSPVSVQPSA